MSQSKKDVALALSGVHIERWSDIAKIRIFRPDEEEYIVLPKWAQTGMKISDTQRQFRMGDVVNRTTQGAEATVYNPLNEHGKVLFVYADGSRGSAFPYLLQLIRESVSVSSKSEG